MDKNPRRGKWISGASFLVGIALYVFMWVDCDTDSLSAALFGGAGTQLYSALNSKNAPLGLVAAVLLGLDV
jgi:hypothetical protein